jgi:hypothetical protein
MSVLFKKCQIRYSHLRPAIKLNCHRASSSYKGITVDSVKAEFHRYEGGSVKLVKNEESGIATISLCHPEKRNAISGRMMCQLSDIVSELENWSDKGRAVLLKSDDEDYFCSGADLTSTVVHISRSFKMINSFHDTHRCTRLKIKSLGVWSSDFCQKSWGACFMSKIAMGIHYFGFCCCFISNF